VKELVVDKTLKTWQVC